MKVYFTDEKTLVIEPENIPESMALKVWHEQYQKEESSFLITSQHLEGIWGYDIKTVEENA